MYIIKTVSWSSFWEDVSPCLYLNVFLHMVKRVLINECLYLKRQMSLSFRELKAATYLGTK